MNVWLWVVVLGLAAWAAHWGADQLLTPLKMLRKQWGLTASAGAALLAIVTASPEVAVNVTSAARGVSEIGLGNLLGSNIISIPLHEFWIWYRMQPPENQRPNCSSENLPGFIRLSLYSLMLSCDETLFSIEGSLRSLRFSFFFFIYVLF